MKKKTKILAIVLSCVLGAGAIFGGSLLINKAANKVKGTEAAKILLARDRMDASDTEFKWTDIVSSAAISNNSTAQTVNLSNIIKTATTENYGELVSDIAAGKVYKNANQYIFKDISGASYDGLITESRLYGIEFRAEQSATIINYLKNKLNIVNKWVKDGYNKYYLKVENNTETLINYYEDDNDQKSLTVVKRETREDTKCVYSIFVNDMKENKLSNPVYLVYVPGERYEYYYEHDGNIADYLIAEKERGYWNICQPKETLYHNTMVSDNFALMTTHNYENLESTYFTIATTDLKEDVLTLREDSITIHISAFNGINYISADESVVTIYKGSENVSYVPEYGSDKVTITLNNGTTLKKDDTFTYNGVELKFDFVNMEYYSNPGFADPQYDASFTLNFNTTQSTDSAINLLNAFLQDHDLTCKYDISNIKNFTSKNKDVVTNMPSYYQWNGYYIGSEASFNAGREVVNGLCENMFNYFTQVKDEPV